MNNLEPRRASEVRCSDTDRNMVADLLSTAYADGRITGDEHQERLEAAWQAKTFGDLEPLTADLLLTPVTALYSTPAATNSPVVIDALNPSPDIDQINCFLGDAKREGVWRMRPRTQNTTFMGDTVLDLRQVVLEATECSLNVSVVLGDVTLIVPEGLNVRDQTSKILGDSNTQGLRPGAPGGPTIVVSGFVFMGDLNVYGPDSRRVQRMDRKHRRALAREQRQLTRTQRTFHG